MNNSKKMTEIIEKKKELSQEKTPKYGTRKLSIGLVSCMLGFSLIIAPGSSKAAEASENETVATQTNTPEENPIEEATPVANEEIKKEETKEEVVEQAQEVVAKQADTFVEKLEAIEVEEGEEIDYKQAVTNLPQDAKLDVITPVNTKEAGEKTTSAKITFADGSVKEIQIKVNVKAVEAIEEAQDLEFSEKVEKQAVKAPENPSTGVRDAAPPEESEVAADANNAVHAYVGVVNGLNIDADLSKASDNQFKPIKGIKAYFQWFEKWSNGKEYSSPVYTATSGADGQLHMGIKSYIAEDGNLIRFDADTTVSAGNERYRFWIDESTIPEGYQLQYITGESVIFPDQGLPITQGGSGSNTARNIHGNWKILLMQKPLEQMHKKPTPTEIQHDGGYLTGKVGWDYKSGIGGIKWNTVADTDTPAKDVTVKASYLSDYALKQIYSDSTAVYMGVAKPSDIRGSGWTAEQEKKLQDWIKEQVKKDPDKWIAETVSAKTNADGKYIIQFKGTWGNLKNRDAGLKTYDYKVGDASSGNIFNKWTQEQIDRLGTVADTAKNGKFNFAGAATNQVKHVNYDWLFVSVENADHLRVMTPYNNNQYTQMSNVFGINSGWSGTGFGVGVTNAVPQILRADFALAPGEIKFNITNYDSGKNTAKVGDVAKTSTEGLPYNGEASENFRIVWYDEDGNEVQRSSVQKPSSTGSLESADFDTSKVTKTTNYTAKLYRVDSAGKNAELLAQDSFTVVVEDSKKITSMYDEFEYKNPNPLKDATYSAKGLPDGLEIDPKTGDIKGVAKESGKFEVEVISVVPDESGDITASRFYTYTVTDSPLEDGNVGKEYNKKVEPKKIDGYVYKNVSAKFIDGKAIDGLTIAGDQITGTPTKKVDATQEDPNVEVTYDIYKLNEKGEEILIKKGHVDRVPLSIKEVQEVETADKVQPGYTDADAQVGKPTTITAPNFTDDKGQDTTKPEGTKFALGKDAPAGAKIDENTGKITYTPTEDKAGQDVKIPVVVTYKDGSTDKVKATVTVAKLDDIIDRTDDPTKPTPAGYVRVTFEASEGVDPLQGAKVYDVKEGTVLTADKYPTVTAKDGYENPTWSTKPGTAITKGNATITATATKKNEETSAKPVIDDVTEGDKIISGKGEAGSDIVVMRGKDLILKTKVNDDGTWSVKVPDGKTLKKGQKIVVKQTEKDKKPATENTTVKEKAPVVKPEAPTLKANDDGSVTVTPPTDKDVDVVQITYTDENNHEGTLAVTKDAKGQWKLPDGTDKSITIDPTTGVVTIPANQVKDGSEVKAVAQKGTEVSEEAKVNAKNNPVPQTDAKKNPAVAPEKTEVADKTALTPEEKAEVEKKVKEKNPKAEKVEVGNDGSVTLTYPDKSTNTLTPEQTVTEKAGDTETDAKKNPAVAPEKTEVADKTALTPEEKAEVEKKVKEKNPKAEKVEVGNDGSVTLTYPDKSTNTLTPEQTVTEKAGDTETDAKKNPAVAPEKTEVADKTALTPEEKAEVEKKVKEKNPKAEKVEVGNDGSVTLTYPDKSTNTLTPEQTVTEKGKPQTDAEKNPAVAPEKTEVVNKTALTDAEKSEVEEKVKKANPNAKDVTVGNDGSVTLTYPDGSINTLTPEQTVTEKGKPQTDAEKNPAVAPEKTEVVNKTALTDAEKSEVEEKVKKANPNAKDVTVGNDGSVTLTYPDGSINTLTP
ncbi:Rib/alpha-like domain-containing protein, partial [Anaerococcus vaginalis]|uniref:Rib/alpha-like domain-containing protein n=2 Tax=Anaerococcus TaxID=165779 RepID=UPI003BAA805D